MDDEIISWLLEKPPIHIIGGGGVGMSGLALLMIHLGYEVSASDLENSFYLGKIAEAGGETWQGSSPERVKPGAAVFFSSAVPVHDEERKTLSSSGWQVMNRFLLLKFISSQFFTIAVSGTHGKTTSSAMLAVVLEQLGADPTAIIGGTVQSWQTHIRLGRYSKVTKPLLVLEADESDGSFNYIESKAGIITNIELDHTDRYSSLEQVEAEFKTFARGIQQSGGQVFCSPGAKISQPISSLTTESKSLPEKVQLEAQGEHNRQNAANVIEVVSWLGYDRDQATSIIQKFNGVARRMQLLGKVIYNNRNIDVIDDYAHHPTELKAVFEALRDSYERIILVWEPHRPSRINVFAQQFKDVIEKYYGLPWTLQLPVFAASEERELAPAEAALSYLKKIKSAGEVLEFCNKNLEEGVEAAILVAGAGNSSEFAHLLVDVFTERGR